MLVQILLTYLNENCLLTLLLFVPLAVFIIKYFFKVGSTKSKRLPSLTCSRIALCYALVSGIRKKKRGKRPTTDLILCGILQVIRGYCKVFERERIFQIYVSMKPLVYIFKPETVEAILSDPIAIDKANEYKYMHPWLGTGLITSWGKKWRYRRKLLTPTFHFRILDDFLPIFNEQSNILVSIIKNHETSVGIDIVPLITSCTLDIIAETAMGVSINAQKGECIEYSRAINELGMTFIERILRPWLSYDFIFNRTSTGRKFYKNVEVVHGFTRKVIKEKKELLQQEMVNEKNDTGSLNTKKRKAFLELLLKYHLKDPSFTEEDIREEVDTFMFAGHDTTSMAISFTLWLIGLHEKEQKLIHEELDEIFLGDTEREITRHDLARMKYLECVIKESLRLYPAVPFFGREINRSLQIGEYTVEKGTLCLIIPMELHRDPKSFPNPEKFDPERFFPENVANRHPYAFVPFSAGSRNCIGQRFALLEAKTILSNILRNFSVRSKDQRDKVKILARIIISTVGPLKLFLTPRSIT